ncbi:MAG: hypothetical protein UH850_14950 [Paludibacteraceae bacterium]|nr:hypothetical protein [Paludibacteraceae bacterium]
MNLMFAKCCGNCMHSNKPKKPSDHAAHYDVAKTERWCYKHNCYITRETVCDEFEQENKKGGVPAAKRIFKFNQKLQKYNELRDKANRLGITDLSGYALIDGKWYEKYTALGGIRYLAIRCKDRDAEKQLNEIEEKLNEIEVEHKDEERT